MKTNATEVAKRYGVALVELAQEQNALVDVLEELRMVQAVFPVVEEVLSSPIYNEANKQDLLSFMIDVLKLRPMVGNCLKLVLRNGRFRFFPAIVSEYQTRIDAIMGVVRASVVAARPIDPKKLGEFEQALSAHLGKKVFLAPRVDEGLKAGYVVEVGGAVIDASLKMRLKNLRETLSRGV
jgi:F-type H+-transporting ATPase subunit delta